MPFLGSFVFSVTVCLIRIIKILKFLTCGLTCIKCIDWYLVTYKRFMLYVLQRQLASLLGFHLYPVGRPGIWPYS